MREAFEKIFAIAEFHIRLERQIGAHLQEAVHRGGRGSKSGNPTSKSGGSSAGLPEGINKDRAWWYRKMAAVPEGLVTAYLAQQKARMKLPSSNGVVSLCSQTRQVQDRVARNGTKPKAPDESVWAPVWQVIPTVMDVSVAVGVDQSLVKATRGLAPDRFRPRDLNGNVVVQAGDRIEEWLRLLYERKQVGAVAKAIVVFTAATGEAWFRLIDLHGWTCCFLRGSHPIPCIVGYRCEHPRPFALAMSRLGTIVRGAQAQVDSQ